MKGEIFNRKTSEVLEKNLEQKYYFQKKKHRQIFHKQKHSNLIDRHEKDRPCVLFIELFHVIRRDVFPTKSNI